MRDSKTLAGKRALITGGSRGIGRSIALAFAEAGATIAISARKQTDLDATGAEIRALGVDCATIICDVTDAEQVERMAADATDAMGGIDILVNNAGAADSHKFIGHPDALWHTMLAVNLTGAYYVCKVVAPLLIEQEWGRIINIASIASKVGNRYIAAYTAAKHGVLGLTRALAAELAPHVTVNAICPSYVDTPMTDATIENIIAQTGRTAEQARAALEKLNPQNRLIQPEEIAAVALMLAQASGKGITGQAINVDGGAVMW